MASFPISLDNLRWARQALGSFVRATPLIHSPSVSQVTGVQTFLKAENLQRAGSFKVRGAYIKLTSLSPEERQRGVIAASAGNHAQGVALAAQLLDIPSTIVMPVGAPITKVGATQAYGAQVVLSGDTYDDAFQKARELQVETGATLIHGFDDPAIISGQSSIGLEILDDLPDVGSVFVPVGGGGLVSGIALAIKQLKPDVKVIGVQAAGCPSVYLGKQQNGYVAVTSARTIADGIAVKTPGVLNMEIINSFVDEVVLVEEEEIAESILVLLERCKLMVEGAGAVGMAALLKHRAKAETGPVCVVLSGGNIDGNVLSRIIERGLVQAGRYVRLAAFVPDRPGGLQRLLATVAAAGSNVIEVHHDRWLNKTSIGEVEIDLSLETRGPEHINALIERLKSEGYETRVLPAFRPRTEW